MRRRPQPKHGQSDANDRSDGATRPSRRHVISGIGVALAGAVAGCTAFGNEESPGDQSYMQLQQTAVYLADGVDLSVPGEVETVDAPTNADLLVLPGETAVEADQAVTWLADERVIALLGGAAESTWLTWAQSDAYRETFDEQGVSDSEPDPSLLVAGAVDLQVPTYRHSWSGDARDRDILRALDEDLTDIESRTPA